MNLIKAIFSQQTKVVALALHTSRSLFVQFWLKEYVMTLLIWSHFFSFIYLFIYFQIPRFLVFLCSKYQNLDEFCAWCFLEEEIELGLQVYYDSSFLALEKYNAIASYNVLTLENVQGLGVGNLTDKDQLSVED